MTDMCGSFLCLLLLSVVVFAKAAEVWKPTSWNHCRTNADCKDTRNICCSITPSLGKREAGPFPFPEFVHYCLPYKVETAPWCDLRMQYNVSSPHYFGLCPCGPGLRCEKTTKLDPESYPRDRYGKCRRVQ